jgi:hypothetical protein
MVYEISLLILVLFLAIAPHVLWIRWIIRAFRKRHTVGRVISVLSYILFLIPFWVLLKGGNRYYGRSAAAEKVEVYVLLGMGLLSILLPLGSFFGRWTYAAYRQKRENQAKSG